MNTKTLPEPGIPASTESRGYIQDPKGLEEFENNARFQLDNVKGYLLMDKDGLPAAVNAALLKADCLIQEAFALKKALVKEFNQREAAAIAMLDQMKGGAR